MKDKERKRK